MARPGRSTIAAPPATEDPTVVGLIGLADAALFAANRAGRNRRSPLAR